MTNKMTPIFKISFAALFIAIGIVLSRFASISITPFLKVSLAPSIVMFSSLYLGPVYGFVVGTLTDVFGALLFPTGAFNPLYTIAASLTGLIPFLAYFFLKKVKFEEKFPFIGASICVLFTIGILLFCIFNDQISSEYGTKKYDLLLWHKLLLSIGSLILSAVFIFFCLFIPRKLKNRKFNKYYSVNLIASSVFITYFIFKIPVGSLVQSYVMEVDFLMILTVRMLTGFLTAFIHIIVITLALDVSLLFNIQGTLLNENYMRFKKEKNNSINEKEPTNTL